MSSESADYEELRAAASRLLNTSSSMVEVMGAFLGLVDAGPDEPDAWMGMALAARSFGPNDKATECAEEVLRLTQNEPDLRYEVAAAEVLARSGELRRAASILEGLAPRIRAADRTTLAAYPHAGAVASLKAGKRARAEELLLLALEEDPSFALAQADLIALRHVPPGESRSGA